MRRPVERLRDLIRVRYEAHRQRYGRGASIVLIGSLALWLIQRWADVEFVASKKGLAETVAQAVRSTIGHIDPLMWWVLAAIASGVLITSNSYERRTRDRLEQRLVERGDTEVQRRDQPSVTQPDQEGTSAQSQPPAIRQARGRVVVTPEAGPVGSTVEIAMGGGRILRSGETVRIFFGDNVITETTVGPGYFYGFKTIVPRMEPGPYVVRAVGMESQVEMFGRFTVIESAQNEPPDE